MVRAPEGGALAGEALTADISVIGPRAITYDELGHFGADQARLLSVPPGITGLWQVGDRNAATFENGTRQAIELWEKVLPERASFGRRQRDGCRRRFEATRQRIYFSPAANSSTRLRTLSS